MTNSAPQEILFETFVLSLGTATLVALGEIENPVSKKKEEDLSSAKQNIDILEMMSKKTSGNLSESEGKLMNEILYQLRIKFLEHQKKEKR